MKYFTAKAAKKSANVTPASPMDTWTADRTFAQNQLNFIWAVIRSAVLYSAWGRRDNRPSYCGFRVKILKKPLFGMLPAICIVNFEVLNMLFFINERKTEL
jgi:hypothetical protein